MENLETKEAPIEYSIIVCKGCGETKKRVMDGRYPNSKDVRWINPDTGKQFSGAWCDSCHRERVAQRKRNNKKAKAVV